MKKTACNPSAARQKTFPAPRLHSAPKHRPER